MDDPLLEFVPSVFFKVLAATLTVVLVGWAGALWLFGELSNVDIIGSLICVPIFAYMVHLWIVYARDREMDE
ncbi:MAG TPA: hypothetical protein VM243_07020 [Phycisphaerae bacterium]|nr:hypothetical protein [Phycisphaerae bacterium]